jgi:hypothetical protein
LFTVLQVTHSCLCHEQTPLEVVPAQRETYELLQLSVTLGIEEKVLYADPVGSQVLSNKAAKA